MIILFLNILIKAMNFIKKKFNFFIHYKDKLKKKENKTIFKNTTVLFISRAITSLLTVLTFFILAKILGDKGVGLIFGVLSLVLLIYPFSDFGYSQIVVREISREPSNSRYILSKGLGFTILSSFLFFGLVILISLWIKNFSLLIVFIMGISYLFFHGIIRLFVTAFQGFDKLEVWAWMEIADNIIRLIFTIIFLLFKKLNIFTASYTYLISSFLCFIIVSLYARKFFGEIEFRLSLISKKEFIESNHFSINFLGESIFFNMDKVILSRFSTLSNVGIYTVAQKVYSIFINMLAAFLMTTYPWFFRYGKKEKSKYLSFALKVNILIFLFGIISGCFVFFFASYIVKIIGSSFNEAIFALKFLASYPLLRGISTVLGDMMTGADFQKERMQITIFSAFFNVFMDILLVFKYGWRGVAFATLLSYFLILILEVIFLYKKGFFKKEVTNEK